MLGENWLIFALEPKLELDAETLILHSGPKFLCFVVHFCKYFWFWCQTEIVYVNVYAAILAVLGITSLKMFELPAMDTLACNNKTTLGELSLERNRTHW